MLATTASATSRISGVALGPAAPVAADAGAERMRTAANVAGMTLRENMTGSVALAGCRILGVTLGSAFGPVSAGRRDRLRLAAAAPHETLLVPAPAATDVLPA